ncbi:VOC family protein [Fodinicola acaciae]|uniref:VOC family protein n=1 Tax=Fodinicola acaciae TaxID=2681555 RepID=UPI0013D2B0FF|nr:VOC family protein [Fodinicola acaciae]
MIIDSNPTTGTPTWLELEVSDPDQAAAFYGAVFGWSFEPGPAGTTRCLLNGRTVAGLRPAREAQWLVHLATDDCDRTAERVAAAGGKVLEAPAEFGDAARIAYAEDPVGARFGLWQGRRSVGCEVVNEPDSLVRNDLVTPAPGPARAFYPAVFDFFLDGNDDLPGVDFTFLRLTAEKEVGGIMGDPSAARSSWNTLFEVADCDTTVARAVAAGAIVVKPAADDPYARSATLTDPFGATFSVGSRHA